MNWYVKRVKPVVKYMIDIHHGLGDVIHMLPVIYAIKEKTSQSHIALIVSKQYIKDFILSQKIVDEVFVLNCKKDILALLKKKYFLYDFGIVAPCIGNVSLSTKLLRLVGCKKIVHEDPDSELKERHRVDRNIELVSKIGIVVQNSYPHINLDKHAYNFSLEISNRLDPLKGTIAICIGGNPEKYVHDGIVEMVDVKRWPINYYHELVKMLQSKFNLILLGGKADADEFWLNCDDSNFSSNVLDLLGKTTVMQSAGALQCCDLAAGNDTGMIHVAAALGKRTIAVYCSTNPSKIGAYSHKAIVIDEPLDCKYCYLTQRTFLCSDKRCLHQVKPYDYYIKILNAMKTTGEVN